MSEPSWKKVLLAILSMQEVDDVVLLHKKGGLMLDNNRVFLPVNIYLKPEQPSGGTLSVHTKDGMDVDDVPMG